MDHFGTLYALLKGQGGGGGGGGNSSGYKGYVASASNLPSSGSKGDMYFVEDEATIYIYDGGWNAISNTAITQAQIDALWP